MDTSQSNRNDYRQLRDTVYTFFYYSNKPVAMTEIVLQFKGAKKPALQAVLDDLVAKEKIFSKDISRSKVYCLAQDMSYEIDHDIYTDEIDRTQDQTVEDKTQRYLKWCYDMQLAELNAAKEESRALDSCLSEYENQMSVEELRKAVKGMRAVVKADDEKETEEKVSYEDFMKLKKVHGQLKKELEKRSRIFKEIVNGFCEGSGMSKSDLYANAGIEDL